MASMFSRLLVGRGHVTAIRAISILGVAPLFSKQRVLKCDEGHQFVRTPYPRKHLLLSRRSISQFATGSLAGLCAGVVLRILSPLLALISGVAGLTFLVASKYGITGWPVFQGAIRASRMRLWGADGEKFVFRVTFVTTLMLAAFVHF